MSVAELVLPVIEPKAYLPGHRDGLWGAFEAGVPMPYADPPLEDLPTKTGVKLLRPDQYMEKWRLDRHDVHAVDNTAIKRALAFSDPR